MKGRFSPLLLAAHSRGVACRASDRRRRNRFSGRKVEKTEREKERLLEELKKSNCRSKG